MLLFLLLGIAGIVIQIYELRLMNTERQLLIDANMSIVGLILVKLHYILKFSAYCGMIAALSTGPTIRLFVLMVFSLLISIVAEGYQI
jgi:hypothetical protein